MFFKPFNLKVFTTILWLKCMLYRWWNTMLTVPDYFWSPQIISLSVILNHMSHSFNNALLRNSHTIHKTTFAQLMSHTTKHNTLNPKIRVPNQTNGSGDFCVDQMVRNAQSASPLSGHNFGVEQYIVRRILKSASHWLHKDTSSSGLVKWCWRRDWIRKTYQQPVRSNRLNHFTHKYKLCAQYSAYGLIVLPKPFHFQCFATDFHLEKSLVRWR